MSYKSIERSREIRLWIGQVIVPAIVTGVVLASNPNVRKWASDKWFELKTTVKQKIDRI